MNHENMQSSDAGNGLASVGAPQNRDDNLAILGNLGQRGGLGGNSQANATGDAMSSNPQSGLGASAMGGTAQASMLVDAENAFTKSTEPAAGPDFENLPKIPMAGINGGPTVNTGGTSDGHGLLTQGGQTGGNTGEPLPGVSMPINHGPPGSFCRGGCMGKWATSR